MNVVSLLAHERQIGFEDIDTYATLTTSPNADNLQWVGVEQTQAGDVMVIDSRGDATAASMGNIRLSLEPGADGRGTLTLSANAAEVGENTSVHDAVLRGEGGTVALNVRFLADGIAAIITPSWIMESSYRCHSSE